MKKKIIVIFGTRPEAIKLAPVINELKVKDEFDLLVCSTGQHKEMLKHVLDIFNIDVDSELDLMKKNQDLFDISTNALIQLKKVFIENKPDLILVQGDTTTAFIASLAAYYLKIKVGHVEAGLRSYNNYSPFPEEVNRRLISVISELNFVPTDDAKQNLLNEGFDQSGIFITGNTVVDSLEYVKNILSEKKKNSFLHSDFESRFGFNPLEDKYILVTMHRREKFGFELESTLNTIREIAKENTNYKFIYPVHLNPNVKAPVERILSKQENILLLPPLDYLEFIFLMANCYFILSDSGGVQEECYVFSKPILVMRDVTERNEAIKAGYAFLVGSDSKKIKSSFKKVDEKLKLGFNFFTSPNPFGDGKASQRIIRIIKESIS